MMSSQDKQTYDDRLLTRYLLGGLPAEEAERLDELSIADDELAARLSAVENDLVDAYVRNELSGEDLEQFKSFYLASAKRSQKVEFAAAWVERTNDAASAPSQVKGADSARRSREKRSKGPSAWRAFSPQWGFAGAALVMLLVAGYLLLENAGLRKQMREGQTEQAALNQREQQLQKQLNEQRSANAEALKELERVRESQTNLSQLKTVSLLLPPPTRGGGRITSIALGPGTNLAVLLLALESDDFPAYRATLRDPAGNRILWRSTNLEATSLDERKLVSISVPAGLLKEQNYLVELTGIPARGSAEPIAGYPFRVVLK
jgi:Tfp pilus assembly protein PilN